MKYILTLCIALLFLPVWGQQSDSSNRKLQIERCAKNIYSSREFRQIADSLQMSVAEISDCPIIFPIKKSQHISSGFGWRRHPIYGRWRFHTGIDIPQAMGTPVYATGNGFVVQKGYNAGYGNFIEIQHAGDFRSFYAHLSKMIVNVGDSIRITQPIGSVGDTGIATGSHLHYEIRKGNRYLNPIGWCYLLYEMLKKE